MEVDLFSITRFVFTITDFVIIIWVIAEIFIIKWMFSARPTKDITEKYPKKIIFMSQFPFGKFWKMYVEHEDLEIMAKYQYRIKIWFLSIIIPLFIIPWILGTFLMLEAQNILDRLDHLKQKFGLPLE